MSQTAWKVGQESGIVDGLDYETVYLLSKTYDLQENSVKRSIEGILHELLPKWAIKLNQPAPRSLYRPGLAAWLTWPFLG